MFKQLILDLLDAGTTRNYFRRNPYPSATRQNHNPSIFHNQNNQSSSKYKRSTLNPLGVLHMLILKDAKPA